MPKRTNGRLKYVLNFSAGCNGKGKLPNSPLGLSVDTLCGYLGSTAYFELL